MNYVLDIYKNINSPLYLVVVAQDLKDWKSKGIDLKISINITPYNIQSKEFVKKMLQLMDNFKESFSAESRTTTSSFRSSDSESNLNSPKYISPFSLL